LPRFPIFDVLTFISLLLNGSSVQGALESTDS
jgi:hypothetical protein